MRHPTSVKGVLLIDRSVLLVKNPRGEWELPGGRPEAGENHQQALSREFTEELSIQVAVGNQIDSYLFEVIPGRHVFIVTYSCTLTADFTPVLSSEHVEHCLWPVDRLSELDLPVGYRRSIEKWASES
jgi:8-oxo-dGTP pyrophosphatase MutT (NUDIX family)